MSAETTQAYEVLARKYRPTSLSSLVGQDALVQTLSHAIETDRIPHAFVLTGIRGVGKTSTARIIARSLLCVGADEQGNTPVVEPCGVCSQCKAIATDSHVDVIELDAASRTGVNDVREIIESVQYAPVTGRYKLYIIDEVHMLSKSAFNALLKTLEEPPAHTKFIFATTEVQKIPVTILSRCMRFDLPRVSASNLAAHLKHITESEGITAEEAALEALAEAGDGSVRDSISLLDQAISHAGSGETLTLGAVHTMLGVTDANIAYSLLQQLSAGDVAASLQHAAQFYQEGGNPFYALDALLRLTHQLTEQQVLKQDVAHYASNEAQQQLFAQLAGELTIPVLSRVWQMCVQGKQEMQQADAPKQALDMLLVRISYAASLPTPEDLLAQVKKNSDASSISNSASNAPSTAPAVAASASMAEQPTQAQAPQQQNVPMPPPPSFATVRNMDDILHLLQQAGEPLLQSYLREMEINQLQLEERRIEVVPLPGMEKDVPGRIASILTKQTGSPWFVVLGQSQGKQSINSKAADAAQAAKQEAVQDVQVQKLLQAFPESKIVSVAPSQQIAYSTAAEENNS